MASKILRGKKKKRKVGAIVRTLGELKKKEEKEEEFKNRRKLHLKASKTKKRWQ